MKSILILALVTACGTSLFAEENAPVEKNVNVSTTNDGSGKAIITIEVNGKKEVRVVDLNNPATTVSSAVTSDVDKETPKTWLGVSCDELSEELAAQLPFSRGTGVIVRHVAENSPATKIGVQKHDILLKLDDQIITDGRQLQKLVQSKKPGDSVTLTTFRRGNEQKLTAILEVANQRDWGMPPATLPVIDVGSGKLALQDLLKNYAASSGASGARANLWITKPDGTVVTQLDTGDIKVAEILRKAEEALSKSKVTGDILKKVEQALAEVGANAARAAEQAAQAMKRAEEASRRAAEAARRADEQIERDSAAKPKTN